VPLLSWWDFLIAIITTYGGKMFSVTYFYLCLVKGMLTQLAAATAMKGTQRARRGGADWIKNIVFINYN